MNTKQTSRSIGTDTVQTTTNNHPKPKKQGSGLSLFAILLSLAALGFSGYQWYSSKISLTESNTQIALGVGQISGDVTRISDSVARLKEDQTSLQTNIVTQDQLENKIIKANSNFDKQIRDLELSQKDVIESVSNLNEQLRKDSNQFILDEVSQLLRLGNNSAIFTDNAESAINAFTLADTQLKELNNPRYSVVRRKINDEIELLKSIKKVDSENILAQLHAISNKVPSLPLENDLPVSKTKDQAQAENNLPEEQRTWRTELNRVWKELISSVSIQRVDQAPKELLAPGERYFLDQNLQLQLVKAEIALLKGNQDQYTKSIAGAIDWLDGYFDPENDLVKESLSQLKSLKNESITISLPSVAGSYDLLQSIKGGQ